MTVTYHAGRRIQGLDADRTATQLPSGSVGGWVELGRSTSSTPSVSSLADKRYYMVLSYKNPTSATQNHGLRFNSDTDPNYSWRYSANGGTDSTATSISYTLLHSDAVSAIDGFDVTYIANRSANEKLMINHSNYNDATGASNVTNRNETVCKWANTSNSIDEIGYRATGGDWGAGGEIVVLGWDPADTHTNNFWEELASVEASGSVASLESGTISAKKYLWIQCYISGTSASTFCETLFNNDTGSNYASRGSQNGGSDFTRTSQTDLNMFESYSNTTGAFLNAFIINNASNEKLGIAHSVREATSGASSAPQRDEVVFKWTNTSSQITDISFTPQSGTINSGSILKVWGAD